MPRNFRRVLALGLLLTFPHGSWAQLTTPAPSRLLSYDELLALALANNRLLKIDELAREKAQEEADSARTRQLPSLTLRAFEGFIGQLDFTFAAGSFGNFATTGPIPQDQTTVPTKAAYSGILWVEVNQPLTQLWRIRPAVRQLEGEREVMAERRRGRGLWIASELRRVYNGILDADAALAAAVADVALYRELERLAGQQVAAQTAFPVDAAIIQAERARRDQVALTIRNTRATLRQQLDVLVGRDLDPQAGLAPIEAPPVRELDLDAARTKALAQRPDIREAELKVRQARDGLQAKRAERIPDISLIGRYISLRNIEILPSSIPAVGLYATWDPFDWGRKRRDIAATARVLDQATLALQETQAQARVDVDMRYRQLTESRERLNVATLGRDAANQRVQLIRTRRDAQAALDRDVLEAEASSAEAEREGPRAVLACSTAEAELKRALGEM